MVNAAYLNEIVNDADKNYSFLIHTSGKKADHSVDYKQMVKIFEALRDDNNSNHASYFKRIWEIANVRYPGHADDITKHIIANRDRNNLVVMSCN